LEKLEVYQMARELSKIAWEIYEPMDWQTKKVIGDQFITATDSVSANIAEGFGRFHYLDKMKFYYNGRGSLFEAKNWIEILLERKYITNEQQDKYRKIADTLGVKLNNLISVTYKTKKEEQ